MSSVKQAQPEKSGGIDRLSALPDAIVIHILSYLLTTRDKIRTGALSRRWKDLWTLAPKLYFNWGYGVDEGDGSFTEGEFVKHVNRILILVLLSGSKVKDFGVKWPYNWAYTSDVDVWTRFAERNETEKFELDFEPPEDDIDFYNLPQHLFTNSFFRELRFCYCDFNITGSVSWNSLKKLTISSGAFSIEVLEKIVAGAPVLEFLDLYLDFGISHLHFGNSGLKQLILHIAKWEDDEVEEVEVEISAPNVQSLDLSGCFSTCKLVDMTSLVEATFGPGHQNDSYYPILTRAVLPSLLNVQTLTLSTWAIQGIAKFSANDGSPLFPKCKCLTIDTHLWKEDPSAIARLLKNTPEIETLIVTMSVWGSKPQYLLGSPSGNGNSSIDLYWASQEMASNYLTHLRAVKFSDFWTYRTDAIPFVEFLLKNARGLQKVIINLGTEDIINEIAPTEVFEASQKLLSFPRSSPDAKLLVYQ